MPLRVQGLTIGVTFQKRVKHLKVTRNLLASSSLASQLEDVLGNQLISAI